MWLCAPSEQTFTPLSAALLSKELMGFKAPPMFCPSLPAFLWLPSCHTGKEVSPSSWEPPFLASDVTCYLFGQQHVKANKIRSGWRCDQVSAPMAVPGLWQAPGQAFSDSWVVADKQHQSQSRRLRAEGRWKAAGSKPPGLLPPWAAGTLSTGDLLRWRHKGEGVAAQSQVGWGD